MSFKVGNITYSEANDVYDVSTNPTKDKIVPGTPKVFDPSLRLEDFKVQNFTANDFTIATDYYDADGDAPASPAFTVVGAVSHKWYDSHGTEITDEKKMIGCGSGLRQPLTLKINLAAQSHSQYGVPRDSDPAGLEQSYQIKTTSGICYARPNQMNVRPQYTWMGKNNSGSWAWNSGSAVDPDNGGGYSSDFVVISNSVSSSGVVNVIDGGFKASAATKFPTTGFPGATFDLVVTGSPSDWTFSSNGGSAVTVDGTGKVKLNSKPSGAVTITATDNTGHAHYYTFNPTAVWVVPKPSQMMAYASAISACGVESKIPSRAQLTNSPQITATSTNVQRENYYTRAIGGGIFNEWGWTARDTYPGSQWALSFSWTRDPHSSGVQFNIDSGHGRVNWDSTSGGYNTYVACLE
ncbi:Ig-like domain-containing protein [Orbaceae bacterium ac157xtp]